MKNEDLRRMVENLSELATERFAKNGRLEPCWYAVTFDGDMIVLPGMCEDKDMAAFAIREVFRRAQVVAYVFIDEAWTVELSAEEFNSPTFKSASKHPKRREVVIINAENENGEMRFDREIIRPADGKAHLGPLNELKGYKESSGRFVGMLPPKGAAH